MRLRTLAIAVPAARASHVLLCERCGVRIATVRDTRVGLVPDGCVCPACSG